MTSSWCKCTWWSTRVTPVCRIWPPFSRFSLQIKLYQFLTKTWSLSLKPDRKTALREEWTKRKAHHACNESGIQPYQYYLDPWIDVAVHDVLSGFQLPTASKRLSMTSQYVFDCQIPFAVQDVLPAWPHPKTMWQLLARTNNAEQTDSWLSEVETRFLTLGDQTREWFLKWEWEFSLLGYLVGAVDVTVAEVESSMAMDSPTVGLFQIFQYQDC